ncbi:hypothetical protein HCX50_14665 [Microbacterium oxydans]|uniref:hypothetical protein n=1 Tax=unclassified Microbacterium TaxID=2609290 RepID=UPI0014314C00|nr:MULTISPECIES: hypothetical protein [unclassified Microbacterium]MBT2495043.1 hypothetical protein [Microbacterium sp. ISL-59]NJI60672.1 hypothetical protein [Microbacterium sp. B19(2022)]
MTADSSSRAEADAVRGTTTFTARALQRLAVGIAHDVARVSARDVGVQLSDEHGALRIAVTVPVARASKRGTDLVTSGEDLRNGLIEGMRELAGREVGAVDVRYSGVRRSTERRVR